MEDEIKDEIIPIPENYTIVNLRELIIDTFGVIEGYLQEITIRLNTIQPEAGGDERPVPSAPIYNSNWKK